MRRFISAIILLAGFSTGAAAELSTSRESMARAIAQVSMQSRQRVDDVFRKTDPVFVFLPGILGSRLTTPEGNVLWGQLGPRQPVVSRQLAYHPEQTIQAELLTEFQTFGYDRDVYGDFFDYVRRLKISDISHLLVFPYDWRQDLRQTAAQFDAMLRDPHSAAVTRERDVIIVAHSMGGLVTAYWFNKYYRGHEQDYPFQRIARLVYLGTPHRGAASALLSLTDGYRCEKCGAFEQLVLGYFFRNVGAVAYTFPSLFQLLPIDVFVFEEDDDKRRQPRDHFSMETWKDYDWGNGARESSALTWSAFAERVQPMLTAAKAFQTELENFEAQPDAVYFYASAFATPDAIVYGPGGKMRRIETRPGDGRVPEDIAKDQPRAYNANQFRAATVEHGALPRDPAFLAFIRDVCEEYEVRVARQIAALLLDDPELLNAFVHAGALLPIPVTREAHDRYPIHLANQRIYERRAEVTQNAGVSAEDLRKAAQSAEDGRRVRDAVALWLLYADRPEAAALRYETYYHLGKLLLHDRRPAEAVAALSTAELTSTAPPRSQLWNKQMAATSEALADAYSATGNLAEADRSRQAAIAFSAAAGERIPDGTRNLNGDDWTSWSSAEKLMWSVGHAQGYREAVDRIDLAAGQNNACVASTLRAERQSSVAGKVSPHEIVAGIDRFYQDPANRVILIGTAFRIHSLQVLGRDPVTIQELIETARVLGQSASADPRQE